MIVWSWSCVCIYEDILTLFSCTCMIALLLQFGDVCQYIDWMTLNKYVSQIAGNFSQKNRPFYGKHQRAGTAWHICYRSRTTGIYCCGESQLEGRKSYSEHDSVKITILRNDIVISEKNIEVIRKQPIYIDTMLIDSSTQVIAITFHPYANIPPW